MPNHCIATSQLWDYTAWADGEFYSTSLDRWVSWETSCSDMWAYQSHCFECSPGEILDLKSLTWVTEWNATTQLYIQDPQLGDIPICRDFEYFVNANSESPVELGTQDHPYKDLDSVFVEITNFHSHNDRNISVYVMEGTTVFAKSVTYIVNITHVQIEAYSWVQANPGLARMVGLIDNLKAIPPSTPSRFNILGK